MKKNTTKGLPRRTNDRLVEPKAIRPRHRSNQAIKEILHKPTTPRKTRKAIAKLAAKKERRLMTHKERHEEYR